MQRLGKGLKDLPRAEFVLATKFGRYGPNLFDFSAERVRGETWLFMHVIQNVTFTESVDSVSDMQAKT